MIEGFATAGYFNIRCAKCKRETLNEYLGFDPSMPVIRTTCSTCKTPTTTRSTPVTGADSPARPSPSPKGRPVG